MAEARQRRSSCHWLASSSLRALNDDGREVAVDVLDATRQRGLHAEPQPLLAPPHALREDEAIERGLRGAVERGGKGVLGEAPGERLGVLPEREAADVVQGEAEQEVLQVDGARDMARGAQRARGELERGHPRLAVGVEDAVPEARAGPGRRRARRGPLGLNCCRSVPA